MPDSSSIRIRRVYEAPRRGDAARFLVDRLWPRGLAKDTLELDGWLRDIAPSDGLRRWFHHDPDRWEEFMRRYHAELDAKPEALRPLLEAVRSGRGVTLLYAARDARRNNAAALRAYLEQHLAAGSGRE